MWVKLADQIRYWKGMVSLPCILQCANLFVLLLLESRWTLWTFLTRKLFQLMLPPCAWERECASVNKQERNILKRMLRRLPTLTLLWITSLCTNGREKSSLNFRLPKNETHGSKTIVPLEVSRRLW